MPSVCVFCASGLDIDPRYLTLAREVGTAIATRGWTLVSGAGSISMMGAVGRSARAAGGRTIGVIPEALVAMEVADHVHWADNVSEALDQIAEGLAARSA